MHPTGCLSAEGRQLRVVGEKFLGFTERPFFAVVINSCVGLADHSKLEPVCGGLLIVFLRDAGGNNSRYVASDFRSEGSNRLSNEMHIQGRHFQETHSAPDNRILNQRTTRREKNDEHWREFETINTGAGSPRAREGLGLKGGLRKPFRVIMLLAVPDEWWR